MAKHKVISTFTDLKTQKLVKAGATFEPHSKAQRDALIKAKCLEAEPQKGKDKGSKGPEIEIVEGAECLDLSQ